MNAIAIHPLAAIVGQQSRVNVEDAPRESLQQALWHQAEEAREDDSSHMILLPKLLGKCRLTHLLAREDEVRYT